MILVVALAPPPSPLLAAFKNQAERPINQHTSKGRTTKDGLPCGPRDTTDPGASLRGAGHGDECLCRALDFYCESEVAE